TAISCEPAPIANRSSVAVAESETIRSGRESSWIAPAVVVTVTGNNGAGFEDAGDACGATPSAASTSSAASLVLNIKTSARRRREEARRHLPHEPPFLRGLHSFDIEQATWLSPEGHHSCGTAPESHRASLLLHRPGICARPGEASAEIDQLQGQGAMTPRRPRRRVAGSRCHRFARSCAHAPLGLLARARRLASRALDQKRATMCRE